jgi:hypothetical protein
MEDFKGKFISFRYRDRKDIISGFLIDFNENLTLIKQNPADYLIDGYMLLKTNKILKYKRDDDEEFKEKVLFAKGLIPTNLDFIQLTDLRETLRLISDRFGAIFIQNKDDSVGFVGKLIRTTKEFVEIQEIDPKAMWIGNEKFKLKSIRTIEFDTDYINSLLLYNKMIQNNKTKLNE